MRDGAFLLWKSTFTLLNLFKNSNLPRYVFTIFLEFHRIFGSVLYIFDLKNAAEATFVQVVDHLEPIFQNGAANALNTVS